MEQKIKITVFSGSLRKESWSKKFANAAANVATRQGAEVNFIDLNDYPMPMYNEDHRTTSGFPESTSKLKKLFYESDAFIICTPEYNRSIPGVLKNTIDWISRKENDSDPNNCFENRPMLLLSSSSGAFGGMFAMFHLRQILVNLKALVLGEQMPLPLAEEAFDEHENLKDEKKRQTLEKFVGKLIDFSSKLRK